MANIVRQIFEQKLQEIQSRLPHNVSLSRRVKYADTVSFKEVLKQTDASQTDNKSEQSNSTGVSGNYYSTPMNNPLFYQMLYSRMLSPGLGA